MYELENCFGFAETKELSTVMRFMQIEMNTCVDFFIPNTVSNILYGMRHMSSTMREVTALLISIRHSSIFPYTFPQCHTPGQTSFNSRFKEFFHI